MNNDKIPYAIEGILFAAGEPVKTAKLAAVLEIETAAVEEAVRILKYEYDTQERGLMIIDIDEGYQICSRPEYYNYIQIILGEQRRQALSNAAMEALAIIAYKQPVTKLDIEKIRGVSCDHAVNRLLEFDLIKELGRLDAPGRPLLFGTTEQFLRSFGVKSLEELPEINPVQLEEFKVQAEEEVQLTLKI